MYLELDRDNPAVVWVKQHARARPWFTLDPVRGLIRIQANGERETLDIEEIKRLALELVLPIDKAGNA
jgi:hypothetical protein